MPGRTISSFNFFYCLLFQDFKEPLVVAFYDVDYVKNAKGTNYWRNRIMKVAKEQKQKLNYAISNRNDFMQVRKEIIQFSNSNSSMHLRKIGRRRQKKLKGKCHRNHDLLRRFLYSHRERSR